MSASEADSSYNKRREDFPTLKEYDQYLEEVEEMSEWLSALVGWAI